MKKIYGWVALALCMGLTDDLLAQASMRKLPPNINHPGINVSIPFVSLDGNTLLFLSDYAEDGKLVVNYSVKEDAVNWKEPVTLPKVINNNLNFQKGYTLSPDGKTIYLTNMKTGGLGGFDIYKSELKGTTWSELVNFGLPVSTKANDATPTFSADGGTMYFMRCDKMTFDKAEGCKLLMTKRKPNGQWEEPAELPDFINTGNSQTPRIMGDGETLLFASDKLSPGKGGMDLYMTRWNGTTWTAPVALDFANTEGNDQFVSATTVGRYLVKDVVGPKRSEITELLFPDQFRPKVAMKVEGKVNAAAYISVFNKKDQSRVFNGRPSASGQFTVFLSEGSVYDLSIEPEQDAYTFFSKEFDLTKEKFPQVERVNATLKQVASGDEIELAGVSFKTNSFELEPSSAQDLRRAARMIRANSALQFTIDVALIGYQEDSVKTAADMTEVRVDTVKVPVSMKVASGADSLNSIKKDSVVLKSRYHNDRTPHQALEVANYLTAQGVPSRNLLVTHHHQPAALPDKKIVVKLIVK